MARAISDVGDIICEGMAKALWAMSYAAYREKTAPNVRWAPGASPQAADKAADDLATLFEHENRATLEDLWNRVARNRLRRAKGPTYKHIESFGYDLAVEALYRGDDRSGYHMGDESIVVPTFHVEYDGSEMSWHGSGKDETIGETIGARRNGNSAKRVNPDENPEHWPSSKVRSLLFEKKTWTVAGATKWASEHGYVTSGLDDQGSYHRLRQQAPGGGPCRTIEFGAGIKAVVCASGKGRPPGVPNPCKPNHDRFSQDVDDWDDEDE